LLAASVNGSGVGYNSPRSTNPAKRVRAWVESGRSGLAGICGRFTLTTVQPDHLGAGQKTARTHVTLLGKRWRVSVLATSAEVAVRLRFRRSPHGAGGAA
jgi:hypothetical protein